MKIIKSSIVSSNSELRPLKQYNNKLCIRTQNANLIVIKSEISSLKAESNYCQISLRDGKRIICSKTLKEIYGRIDSPKFIKIHKSYAVNVDDIISLSSDFSFLSLSNGNDIPIARAQKSKVREIIGYMCD